MSKLHASSSTGRKLYSSLIFERLTELAANNPDKKAISFEDVSISYSELLKRIDDLAMHLNSLDVSVGNTVGIGMTRSLNMMIAMLGIWRSGAAFVPLDVDHPQFRLNQVVGDTQPRLIICDKGNKQQMTWPQIESISLEDIKFNDHQQYQVVNVTADQMAYTMFTSGSTGRPKGVRVSVAALENFLVSMQEVLNLKQSDVWLAITSLSFDISILELILPLIEGATVILAGRNDSGDGHQLTNVLIKHDCTVLQATPATWQLLLDTGWNGKSNLTVICGGESFHRALAEELLKRCHKVFNAYGPTEATIWALVEPVSSASGLVPIGKPLSNYQAYIMDSNNKLVEPGDVGELYLGGLSLATDYINQPEETAKFFISDNELGRLYATGDLVRKRSDGKFEFIGREDHQVKISGHRIELGDIESQLLNLTDIKVALVTTETDELHHTKLLAYIILHQGNEFSTKKLRQELKAKLPSYMIPNHFIQLTEFPLTHNKKIDYKQLPSPTVDTDDVRLTDPLEIYLQKVWIKILGLSSIKRADDFFDLGGDSILAARITNRIQDWLGELLWPVIIFDAPTIKELAQYLRKNYPQSVANKTHALIKDKASHVSTDRVVDKILIDEFNKLNPPMTLTSKPEKKNPRPIFLLCPPRSGSTLLRVMLAGNSQIFAPPEIEMLTFNTMKERADLFSGRESYRLEGLTRAVMEIKNCDVEVAKSILAKHESEDVTIQQFYGTMQHWLGDRILLDKTPANCLDATALGRIEDDFEEPLYIHLTRHPYGMIRSFLEARLSEVFFRRASHEFSPRELAELIWYTCNHNIHTTLKSVPPERQFRISFENLLASPESNIKQLCEFLTIEYQPEMIEPHSNKEKKMTDGLHKESKMMGDPKFHQHKEIDVTVAERWKNQIPDSPLGEDSQALAQQFGYDELSISNENEDDEREDFIL